MTFRLVARCFNQLCQGVPTLQPSGEVKERIEPYFYSPSGPPWHVLRWSVPLLLIVMKLSNVVISVLCLVQISGLWGHMITIKHCCSIYIKSILIVRDAAAELVHKAATITLNNSHIARVINTSRRPVQNRKRRKIRGAADK